MRLQKKVSLPAPFAELADRFASTELEWEHSVVFSHEGISGERAGFGVDLARTPVHDDLSDVIKRVLKCPQLRADSFCQNACNANYLYFAFSGIGQPEYKMYLEYPVLLSQRVNGALQWGPPAVQLHALKWWQQPPYTTRESIYVRHPGLTVSELAKNLEGDPMMFGVALVQDYLESISTGSSAQPERVDIISVHDRAGGIASAWDLRLYDFSLSVIQLSPMILSWASRIAPDIEDSLKRWVDDHAEQVAGHISFSVNQLNLYFCSKD